MENYKMPMPVLRPYPHYENKPGYFHRVKRMFLDRRKWVLEDDYCWKSKDGSEYHLRKGFVTDLASVPRILWPLGLEPTGVLLVPSLFHDFSYTNGYIKITYGRNEDYWDKLAGWPRPVSIEDFRERKFFDKLFRDMIIEITGMKKTANLAYLAVRTFGGFAWKNKKSTYIAS